MDYTSYTSSDSENDHYYEPGPIDSKTVDSFWERAGNDLFFPNYPQILEERGVDDSKLRRDLRLFLSTKENKDYDNNHENNKDTVGDSRDSKRVRKLEPIDPYELDAYMFREKPDYCHSNAGSLLYDPAGDRRLNEILEVLPLLSHGTRDYLVRVGSDGSVTDNDRVKVWSLKQKYFIVCCFFVPVAWNHSEAMKLSSASTELKMDNSLGCNVINIGDKCYYDFEIVVVAKMRSHSDNDEAAFKRFVSGFPNCLTVPFEDKEGRDIICKSLGCEEGVEGLVFGPNQVLLQDNICFLSLLGLRDAFPFDGENIVYEKASNFLKRDESSYSLEVLLDCELTDTLYKNTTSTVVGMEEEKVGVPISVLREKVVGLYLCRELVESRDHLSDVNYIYQQCRDAGLDFEIVVVYDPYFVSGKSFQERINRELGRHNIASWLVSPFNNLVRRRLATLCGGCNGDRMIIVGPRGKYVETFGLEVMMDFGIQAYPFTREVLVKEELERLRALTVDSLLQGWKGEDLLHLPLHGNQANVKKNVVPRKNVAVYIRWSNSRDVLQYSGRFLSRWYDYVKENLHSDLEMVFAGLVDSSNQDILKSLVGSGVPWYVCPLDSKHSAAFFEKLFGRSKPVGSETIITFGEDGKICSLAAQELQFKKGSAAFTGDLVLEAMRLFRAGDVSRHPYLACPRCC